jgi:predicted nucleic acid-binding protein
LLTDADTQKAHVSMSLINLGEVFYRVGRVHGRDEAVAVLEDIRRTAVDMIPASEEAVFAAADLKIAHAVSYADAFALATAQRLDAVLVTGDPELTQLGGAFQIERLRRRERR